MTTNPFAKKETPAPFDRTRSARLSIDFAVRMGLRPDQGLAESLQQRLAENGEQTWQELSSSGREMLPLPRLQVPRSLLEMLVATLTWERSNASPDDGADQADNIERHYLQWMPAILVENLCCRDGSAAPFFHTPLQLHHLPRLRRALRGAFALLQACDVDPRLCFGVNRMEDLVEGRTLAEIYTKTHFGGCMPMLYTYPRDIAAYQKELAEGAELFDVIDRRLTAPLLHELMHFQRHRRALYPPLLEECVAGYLGVHVYPEFAYPHPGEDNGIYASPLFAQIGQALVKAGGLRKVVMAHAAMIGWHQILPDGVMQNAERLGWQLYTDRRDIHFLAGNRNPRPWVNFFLLKEEARSFNSLSELEGIEFDALPSDGEPETMDSRILADALRAAAVHGALNPEDSTWRVTTTLPARAYLDWRAGVCRRAGAQDERTDSDLVYELLPPSVARGWRDRGVAGHLVTLERAHDAVEIARSLAAWESPASAIPTNMQ